jgi:hypothetical protein
MAPLEEDVERMHDAFGFRRADDADVSIRQDVATGRGRDLLSTTRSAEYGGDAKCSEAETANAHAGKYGDCIRSPSIAANDSERLFIYRSVMIYVFGFEWQRA